MLDSCPNLGLKEAPGLASPSDMGCIQPEYYPGHTHRTKFGSQLAIKGFCLLSYWFTTNSLRKIHVFMLDGQWPL